MTLLLCLAVQPSDAASEEITISETVPADVFSAMGNENGCELSLELTTEYVLTGLSIDGENLLLDALYIDVYYISTSPIADGVRTSLRIGNVSFSCFSSYRYTCVGATVYIKVHCPCVSPNAPDYDDIHVRAWTYSIRKLSWTRHISIYALATAYFCHSISGSNVTLRTSELKQLRDVTNLRSVGIQ